MGNPVIHFEIGGSDAARSRDFYTELFGWTAELGADGYALVDTGSGAGIGGGIVQAPLGVPSWVTFYVGVEDLDETLARAEKLGARRIMEPTPIGEAGMCAMLADLDGNMVGLFEQQPAPARG
ncbi:MAG TPA: VOC family protein [Actinomycetospora sp.]|uniref:VOC family protein n=1 Tax=Actinomycetospora sp. TaxID=1872135 RepID=UPI002F3F7306